MSLAADAQLVPSLGDAWANYEAQQQAHTSSAAALPLPAPDLEAGQGKGSLEVAAPAGGDAVVYKPGSVPVWYQVGKAGQESTKPGRQCSGQRAHLTPRLHASASCWHPPAPPTRRGVSPCLVVRLPCTALHTTCRCGCWGCAS